MEIPVIKEEHYYTLEEYLALEEVAEERHEYHNGKIIEMAGGTANHSLICNSLGTAIENALIRDNKDCVVFNSDMKVWVDKQNHGLYPDVSVICGDIEYHKNSESVLSNPMLLIEVLSKSTKQYDKSDKFELYRSIPSFKEYMIVYQTVAKVQTWYKEAEDLWRIGNAEGLEQSIRLHSIPCEIALKDIYRSVKNLKELKTLELIY